MHTCACMHTCDMMKVCMFVCCLTISQFTSRNRSKSKSDISTLLLFEIFDMLIDFVLFGLSFLDLYTIDKSIGGESRSAQ